MLFTERAALITGPCTCHESYKTRNMIAPDCAYHEYAVEIEMALQEAFAQGVSSVVNVFAKLEIPDGTVR